MQIQQTEIEKIIPYAQNTRKHSEEQINRIAQSIVEFGFNQPIVIDEKNIILVGHGRLEAAKKLGRRDVPVYQLVGLSEAQKRAYRILDNKIADEAIWDFDAMQSEIELMSADDYDVDGWDLDWFRLDDDEDPEEEKSAPPPAPRLVSCPECGHLFSPKKEPHNSD